MNSPGADLFLNIKVKPAANLNRLEEVLVITKKEDRAPSLAETNSVRAADILAQRLPSVPDKPAADAKPTSAEASGSADQSRRRSGNGEAGESAEAGSGGQEGSAADRKTG